MADVKHCTASPINDFEGFQWRDKRKKTFPTLQSCVFLKPLSEQNPMTKLVEYYFSQTKYNELHLPSLARVDISTGQ
jgi:hypothetical protein